MEDPKASLSKNQLRKQRREERYQETKAQRRARDKIKRKLKAKVPKPKIPEDQLKTNHHIIIDCQFDDKMIDKEIKSLSNQIIRCYSLNKINPIQVNLSITSFSGKSQQRFQQAHNLNNLDKNIIRFHQEDYLALFDKEKLVYLSGDADEELDELDDNTVYIIGGIVDKNREKGLCFKKAQEQGIKTMKLPISKYITLNSRSILAVNHVFEILVEYLNLKNWKLAFEKIIPQRKIVQNENVTNVNMQEIASEESDYAKEISDCNTDKNIENLTLPECDENVDEVTTLQLAN